MTKNKLILQILNFLMASVFFQTLTNVRTTHCIAFVGFRWLTVFSKFFTNPKQRTASLVSVFVWVW